MTALCRISCYNTEVDVLQTKQTIRGSASVTGRQVGTYGRAVGLKLRNIGTVSTEKLAYWETYIYKSL